MNQKTYWDFKQNKVSYNSEWDSSVDESEKGRVAQLEKDHKTFYTVMNKINRKLKFQLSLPTDKVIRNPIAGD